MKMEEYRRYNQKSIKGTNNTTYTKENVTYYSNNEKKTISNVGKVNNSLYKQYTSFANKNYLHNNENNKSERRNSFSSNQRSLNNSFSTKQKYSKVGTTIENSNYQYYVSGVGYVTKKEENIIIKKETNNRAQIPKPRQIPTTRPNQIKIQQTWKKETNKKELMDNYQYHETKNIKKENKETIVSHRRLGEPFSSTIQSRNSKNYTSHTEKPRTINKSFQRQEYEIIESNKPLVKINMNKYNYKAENNSKVNEIKYISSQRDNQNRNIKRINENKNQHSYIAKDHHEKEKTEYITNVRSQSINKRKNNTNIVNSGTNQINNNYEIRNNNNYTQNYNNIQKHEIRVTSRDKKITNNNYTKNNNINNIVERTRKNIPKVTNTNTNTRQQYTTTRKIVTEQRKERLYPRVKNINNSSNNQYKAEVHEQKGKYYTLEPVQQVKRIYQVKRGDNIPQAIEQITFYEAERTNQMTPSNIQIHMLQRSQNVPQQVQEIEVHDIEERKENIPQFVQQIEVHQINKDSQDMEKNEEIIQNVEEENIEQNNYEQIEASKREQNLEQDHEQKQELEHEQEIEHEQELEHEEEQELEQEEEHEQEQEHEKELEHEHEQEIHQENLEKIERERKDLEEHEEKKIEITKENKENIEQEEIMSNNENNDIEDNNEQNDEKEANLQIDENVGIDNQEDKLQIQQLDYDQYISQENNTNGEMYQVNKEQYSNNGFTNDQQYYLNNNIHYCPVHGVYHIPYNQDIIMNRQGNFHNQNRSQFNLNNEIGEDGMVGDTNNYRFYESKHLKNEGEINSMTFLHSRGGDKYISNTDSNIYVATNVIPIITDSNFQEYNNNILKKDIINFQVHKDHENCPVHGNKNK